MAGVLPRDLCNGIESAKGAAVPPEFYYWDGQILKAKDGKYHMFMSTWSGTAGFNPGWTGSDAYHAISSQGVLGPYQRQGFVYTNNSSHKGHNVSALELPDGSYAVVVSEIVPFTIYKATSLDGPWTGCAASIQTNGIKTNSTATCPPGGACNDTHYDSNVSLVARPDGKFEIVQRHGFIAIADTLCGPYKMQKPTWTYPQANLPNVDSIYPKRTSIPGVSNPSYGWEEDPHIWYSAGIYHVIYSGSQRSRRLPPLFIRRPHELEGQRVRLVSAGLPEDLLLRGKHAPAAQWYKMERPGVVLENGHPTHITWAVADVDKDNQIPAGSNHGSKVIVVPFDGVAFDADFGTRRQPAEPAAAPGAGGVTGAGGSAGSGGAGRGGTTGTGGSAGTGGGRGGTTGATGGGTGGAGRGGATGATGGSAGGGGAGTGGASGGGATGGATATGGEGGTSPTGGGSGSSASGGRGGGGGSASGGASSAGGVGGSTGGSSSSGVRRQWRLHVHPGRGRRFRLRLRVGLGVARRRARARSAAGRVGHADSQATEPPKPQSALNARSQSSACSVGAALAGLLAVAVGCGSKAATGGAGGGGRGGDAERRERRVRREQPADRRARAPARRAKPEQPAAPARRAKPERPAAPARRVKRVRRGALGRAASPARARPERTAREAARAATAARLRSIRST